MFCMLPGPRAVSMTTSGSVTISIERQQHCPRCGSVHFYRSRRNGLIDAVEVKLFHRKKYYCYQCDKHFHLKAKIHSKPSGMV